MVQHSATTYESQFFSYFLFSFFITYSSFRVQLLLLFIQQPVYVCDQHTANVNMYLLFAYNSNIDNSDICSSVKPAFNFNFNFENAHIRKCYEYLLDKVVFIHDILRCFGGDTSNSLIHILNGNYINRDVAVDGEPELIDHSPYCDQDQSLAVIVVATGVMRAELVRMQQERDESFRAFAARVRGKACHGKQ